MDERGVSEQLGVAVLIGMTVTVTLGLGIGVLINGAERQDPGQADLQFSNVGSSLIITYSSQYSHTAGDVVVQGPEGNVTWAEASDNVSPGDPIPNGNRIELSSSTAYGSEIREGQRFEVIYTEEGEQYRLGQWGGADVGDEIDVGDPGP